jgi:hypothetical protein
MGKPWQCKTKTCMEFDPNEIIQALLATIETKKEPSK